MQKPNFINKSWLKPLIWTGLAIYVYVFMEWLFFATKPSFMMTMNWGQKLMVLFVSSFVFILPGLILEGLSILIARSTKSLRWVIAIVPALVISLLYLILLDNFTYTVFKFGIVTSTGFLRGLYALGFLALFIYQVRKISISLQRPQDRAGTWYGYLVTVLILISTATFASRIPGFHFNDSSYQVQGSASTDLPNIILLGWDGINATHTSLYGYERDTTPNLTKLASNALVFENAYSNAGKTGGALTSMLTGKLSTETRVIFPPDILVGEDAYQHLPGILKQLGYHTVQITMPYYGDAYERNFREGFDEVNFRSMNTNPLAEKFARAGGDVSFYFTGLMVQRISERLAHVFSIKQMENPYAAVTQTVYAIHDDQRLRGMIDYLKESNQPLFLHVHMMDTHGPEFYVPNQYFSAGQKQAQEWMPDFYDDAILNSDVYLKDLFEYLNESGKIKNTFVIFYSDHGIQWDPLARVPLVFWFPNDEYQGKVQENAQLLDVAPTILGYLGVSKPAWMQGDSLITNDLSPTRNIFSANVGNELKVTEDRRTWVVDESKVFPPFYQLGKVNVVVCDQWFSLDLRNPGLSYGNVVGSTAVCPPQSIPSPQQAEQTLLQLLSDEHYDVKNFPVTVPISKNSGE